MNIIKKLKKVLVNPGLLLDKLFVQLPTKWICDEKYIKIRYRLRMGKKLKLKQPITFNEKLQWLKINDRKSIYTTFVDKYEVRKYIEKVIGENHIIPLIGVYNSFEEIDFSSLPNQFVLKTTHDSSGVVVCKDKNDFNLKNAKKKINRSLKRNFYYFFREWQYKDIKPRIICEKYMVDESNTELKDYKFFCFDGEPKMLYTVRGRGIDTRGDFFDIDFNRIPLKVFNENYEGIIEKPAGLQKMIEISRKLSKDLPHVRVDLYDINGHIYFGELTLHHCGGMSKFEPEEYDTLFGSWIDLNKVNKNYNL